MAEEDPALVRAERDLYLRLLELGSHDDLPAFLDEALAVMVEVTGAAQGYLAVQEGLPKEDQPPPFATSRGLEAGDLARVRAGLSTGILREALASGKTVSTASALEDPRFAAQKSVQSARISAVLCAPLGGDLPVGVLYLQGRTGPGPFPERDRRMVEAFAAHVAPLARRLLRAAERAEGPDPTAEPRARLRAERIVGRSPALASALRQLVVAAGVDMNVLLTGESGTGKTVLARTLHASSTRAAGPFVELNCAAIPEPLLEAELFGAEKGAHSTATRRMPGKISAAEGGTLFLDEIGELPLGAQAKLLTFLQSKEYWPLGASAPSRADVRVVAATNAELEELIAERRFREDLFWRLSVLAIRVPPLRERREDVPLLADALAAAAHDRRMPLSWEARAAVANAEWPGNVRQLAAVIQRGAAFAASEGAAAIAPAHLFPDAPPLAPEAASATYQDALRAFQRKLLAEALAACGGNVSEVARRLDLSRSHLHELLRGLGLTRTRGGR